MEQIISLELLFKGFDPGFDWTKVKIHVAQEYTDLAGKRWKPIDVFTRSFDEWQNKWNGEEHSNNCWNEDYIFSMIEMPKSPDCWLFGGIFAVINRQKDTGSKHYFYKVKKAPIAEALIGRLVIGWKKTARAKARIADKEMLSAMTVSEIRKTPYIGEDFPGHGNINHDFDTLEILWKEKKSDWYEKLNDCVGVYLITDKKTGKHYVGSTYKDAETKPDEYGIWKRWGKYLEVGHGGNNKLKELLGEKADMEYARKNFKFSFLEVASSRETKEIILNREKHWKAVLLSKENGNNAN